MKTIGEIRKFLMLSAVFAAGMAGLCHAQEPVPLKRIPFKKMPFPKAAPEKGIPMGYHIESGDTVFFEQLKPIYIYHFEKKKGKNWREYYRLVWNFNKVYPYALKARDIILEADSEISREDMTAKERDRYVRKLERKLFDEFEKPLRNLTFSQGRILLRLIERECGLSSYYIISNYRGKAAAGFWQGVAKLFGSDMKKPYDRFGKDKELEELVKMYQDGSFPFLYRSIFGDRE